jgi:hypothetical protein
VNQLLKDVQSEAQDVFKPIADAVGDALGDGQIKPQGDGGLGKTAEDFTQGGNVPAPPMGDMPGISTEGAGTSRDGGDYGGGGGSSGGSSGGGSQGTTPLGGSSGGSPGSGTGTQPPTAGDLGLDPNSNAYIEYQPNQGQVQISYPDGTTETRPWPPA